MGEYLDIEAATELAHEFPLWRDRLARAGLFRTMQAMQGAQDMIAVEISEAMTRLEKEPPR